MLRQFQTAFIGVFCGVLLSSSVVAKEVADDIFSGFEVKKIAEHTWFIPGPREIPNPENQGFMNNPAFVITDNSVIVLDPGSSVHVGRALLKRIRLQTDKPITHVFNSHIHGDHWLGNQAIMEENDKVIIYAHPKMIELAKGGEAQAWIDNLMDLTKGATKGTIATFPTEALTDQQEVKVDNITIKAHLSEKAHTITDAMFEIVEDKVLITGDNAFRNRAPRLDDGSYLGNMAVLDKALALPVEVVVPGHGPSGGKEVLSDFRDFIAIIYDTTKTLMDEDMEAYEIKPKVVEAMTKYKDWTGYDAAIGKLVSVAVLEVEENF